MGAGILIVLQHAHELLGIDLFSHFTAKDVLQILGSRDAAGSGRFLQRCHRVIILRLNACRIGIALFLGSCQDGLNGGHLIQSCVQEVLMPGLAFFRTHPGSRGLIDGLVLQRSTGIQAYVAYKRIIIAEEALVDILIIEIDLSSRVLLAIDRSGGSGLSNHIGTPNAGNDDCDHKHDRDDAVQSVAAFFLLALFLIANSFRIDPTGVGAFLTELFFS